MLGKLCAILLSPPTPLAGGFLTSMIFVLASLKSGFVTFKARMRMYAHFSTSRRSLVRLYPIPQIAHCAYSSRQILPREETDIGRDSTFRNAQHTARQ